MAIPDCPESYLRFLLHDDGWLRHVCPFTQRVFAFWTRRVNSDFLLYRASYPPPFIQRYFNSLPNSHPSPRVTVLVTNYNHARFLAARWESIFAQSFKDVEFIFLDDGSADKSVDLVRAYAREWPIRIEAEHINRGVFAQWRKGLELAKGEFIWIAEADDVSSPEFLGSMVAVLGRSDALGMAYSQSSIIDEHGRLLETTPAYLNVLDGLRWKSDYRNTGKDEIRDWLVLRNTIPNVSACVFRREALLSVDVEKMGLKLCGDWMTYVQLLSLWDIAFVKEPLNHFRRHSRTARATSDRTGLRIRETYQVQHYIAQNYSPSPERREWGGRLSFAEWQHLSRSSPTIEVNAEFQELLQNAEAFDPAIRERFRNPHRSQLPTVNGRSSSLRSWFRWVNNYQAFLPAVPRYIILGPFRGVAELDVLGKAGQVTLSSLEFAQSESGVWHRLVETGLVSGVTSIDERVRLSILPSGIRIHQCSSGYLRIQPPKAFAGGNYWVRLLLSSLKEED